MSFTSGGDSFSFSGEIDGIESASNVSIAKIGTSQIFSAANLSSSGQSITGGSSINVMSAGFTPNLLALVDPAGGDTTNSYVSLQGAIGFSQLPGLSAPVSGTNSVQMSPTTTSPGITLVAATSASNFTAFDLHVGPAAMSVGYSSSASQFQISGSVGVVTSSGDFSVAGTLGTPTSPGLLISSNGSVTELSLTISSSISTYGLNINANNLLLNYDPAAGNQYRIISGSISAATSAGDFCFEGTFGCGTKPGVVINNGSLTSLYATLNGNTVASGLTMTASNDVLQFNAACGSTPAEYQILSGSIAVGSNATDVRFSGTFGCGPNPGVVIQGGSLTALNITVTSNMKVAGLDLVANAVDFKYNSNGSMFQILSGNVSVGTTDLSCLGVFGNSVTGNAGLTISGSKLTGLDVTITSEIDLDGMSLSVENVQFIYENNASSIYNGDFIIKSGNVTIATSANDTYFSAQFGCASLSMPGLVINNDGSLGNLYTTVSSTISAQGVVINAADLVFQYEGSTQTFEIASGSVSVSAGDLQFASAKFGVSGNPGLVIDKGSLTALNITINSNMSVMGMNLDITSMNFIYDTVAGQTFGNFEIGAGGNISLTSGSASNPFSFSGLFGNTANTTPGLVINNGALQSFYIGITSDISAGGMTISTSDLTFKYQLANNTFEIPNGSISVSATDFNFNGTFGGVLSNGTTAPGMVVSNGVLKELNTIVTSSLVAGGLTFSLNNLDFSYNSIGNQYEIDSGNISFNTNEGFTFSADFGLPNPANTSSMLPGLVVSNGTLTGFNAALYASFMIAGLQIDVNDMAMDYSAGQFQMYGLVSVKTSDVQFNGTIGEPSASPPTYGLMIQNGNLEQCNITINSNVTLGDLSMQAQNLSFNYSSNPEDFSLYGNVTVSVDSVSLTGLLGNSAMPGLSLVNGQLDSLNLGVTTYFSLFGLNCNVDDLTFIYESACSTATYIMYGSLSVSIADGGSTQKIDADMGTRTDPGLTIVGSSVTDINIGLTAGFTVDGFGFDVVDAGMKYQSADATYQIFGTFTLSDVFSASVQLGTQTNPGITVSNSVFIVNSIAISLDNVPIGAFTLNYVDISYNSEGDTWQGAAAVTFPTGWEIGAAMTFVDGNLDNISLFYSADTSQGIAIPDTGVFITYMNASLQNLDEPASIIVSGSIVGDFGGQISIGGVTCRIFTAMGSFSADAQELVISGNYYLGAYQTNNSNPLTGWTGIIGSGTARVDLNWSAGTYTASMNCSMYRGIFVVSAEMAFNDGGDLGLIATATVEVPNSVPFIGGQRLGSISFAFLYTASSNSGIVAAWTSVNCGINITTGFQYAYSSGSSGDFSLIGAGGVNSIKNDFNSITSSDNSVPPVYVYSYTVTVPAGSGSNGISVIASWPANSGTQTLGVSLPGNQTLFYFPNTTASSVPTNVEFLTSYTSTKSQSILVDGSATNATVLLPPGTYTFQLQSSFEFSSTSCVTFTNQLYYEAPTINISSVPAKALAFTPSLTGFAAGALAPNATVTIYIDTNSSGYNGKSAGTFAYSVSNTTTGGSLLNVPSIDLSSYAPGVPIYIYAVINDGTNTPVNSTYSSSIIPVPNVVGQILDQFGNPISGIRVFLDLNDDQNYDAPVYTNGILTSPGDPSMITNINGNYFFNHLEIYNGSNTANGVDIGYPDFRVMALMPSPSFTPISPANATVGFTLNDSSSTANNPTESVVANFTINRLASITGSIYSDIVQNGVYVSTDPALSCGTIYLDTNGNGQYDNNEPTCETGPSGQYGFYDLMPGNYTTRMITSTIAGNININNYVVTQPACGTYAISISSDAQQLGNFTFTGPYTFGVISLATVSGTVNNQTTSTSIATPLPGSIINISTPNLTASVPNYTSFSSSSGLNLIGAAVSSSGSLYLLTPSQSACATAAWYKTAVPIIGGFESTFQWSMTAASTLSGGMTFVIENNGSSVSGNTSFGYGGLTNSIGVIFDAVNNQVMVESGGNTGATTALATLTSQELGFNLASGSVYTARVVFVPFNSNGQGNLSVYFSGDSSGGFTPALTMPVNLVSSLNLGANTSVLMGFTAGTTGTGFTANVASWCTKTLISQTTTTDSSGSYSFTGLMPLANYTITQLPPVNYAQSSPLNTLGIYSESTLASLANINSSIAPGDFNGDGISDVVYATSLNSGNAYQIMYAYGNGNGTFSTVQTVNLPVPASSPALATPTYGSAQFDTLIASGTFGSATRDSVIYTAIMANGGQAIVVYDIYSGKILNLIEVGGPSSNYSPTNTSPTQGYAGTINNIAVGDLNNDGYEDVAVSTYGGIFTLVSMQNIQSSTNWSVNPTVLANPISTPSLYYANGTSGNADGVAFNAGVAIADFNQDGNLDLATIGIQYIPEVTKTRFGPEYSWSDMSVGTTLQLAYGSGNGLSYSLQAQLLNQLFTQANIDQYFTSTSSESQPTFALPFGIATGDITGDGVSDIILNGYSDNLDPSVILLQQLNGNLTNVGSFEIPNGKAFNINSSFGNNIVIPGSTTIAAQAIISDFNCDGYDDVAAVDPNFGQLYLLTTNSTPLSNQQTQTTLEMTGGALPQSAMADYNLDGYPDMIVPGMNNGTTQTSPILILNGTINAGYIAYTPANGQALTAQNFTDIYFGGSAVTNISASSMSMSVLKHPDIKFASVTAGLSLTGQFFIDKNQNSRINSADQGLGSVQIYLDMNNNGQFETGVDLSTITNGNGYYSFDNVPAAHRLKLGFVGLPAQYSAEPLYIDLPLSSQSGFLHRSIAVNQRWMLSSLPDVPVIPLTPCSIDVAPFEFRKSLDFKPVYQLVGSVPAGMTINADTGLILWTPPFSIKSSTIDVIVKATCADMSNMLMSQTNLYQLRINPISPAAAYVRNIFGTMLERQPSEAELTSWTSGLQSGVSRVWFVDSIGQTDEYYNLLTKKTYLHTLSRQPTAGESQNAIAMFRAGGNSDQLTKQILASQEFTSLYPSTAAYVAAVNQRLVFKQPSATLVAWESRWLTMGGSRASLVHWIFNSQAAAAARVNQIAGFYFNQPQNAKILSRWATALVKGRLNSDTLALRILSSANYANSTSKQPTPNVTTSNARVWTQYNRLAHLKFSLSGADATRSELDQLESRLYQGQSWQKVTGGIYASRQATTQRIQTQYQNILHRAASSYEISSLLQSLPLTNQVEVLQMKLLGGSEYRSRFPSAAAYISAVYQTLTGSVATDSQIKYWSERLDSGTSTMQFTQSVAGSNAGKAGQIERAYVDYLMRNPSRLELQQWLGRYRNSSPQDRSIALTLLNSNEYRQQQRSANLLPADSNPD